MKHIFEYLKGYQKIPSVCILVAQSDCTVIVLELKAMFSHY